MLASGEPQNVPGFEIIGNLQRRLLSWSDNDPVVDWAYVVICLLLTLMAGLMSGLTLGLLSLDTVELEVLLRSGTPKEQKYARKIMPVVANSHLLLVTLLLCNALSMEALPLFLDKLADPITAVLVSVTAVLFFGEIIPQSVCSRYGLAIGASLAPLVRGLMLLCSPVAWPMGKLLDVLLGPDHHTLFRRRQLKELVSIHAEDAGLGGALTRDEIKVITGALDLTSKVAYRAMTPLDKVFMLSSSDRLDEATLRAVLRSGHSRIPVHAAGDRCAVVGLLLVKELLQYRLVSSESVPVGLLRLRSVPRLPATTPMYDMLRLFQTGRSHIAVLTQPPPGELRRLQALDPAQAARRGADGSKSRSGHGCRTSAMDSAGAKHGSGNGGGERVFTAGVEGLGGLGGKAPAGGETGGGRGGWTPVADDARSVAASTECGDMDTIDGYLPYNTYYRTSTAPDRPSYQGSLFLSPQDSCEVGPGVAGGGGAVESALTSASMSMAPSLSASRVWTATAVADAADAVHRDAEVAHDDGRQMPSQISSAFANAAAAAVAANEASGTSLSPREAAGTAPPPLPTTTRGQQQQLRGSGAVSSSTAAAAAHRLTRIGREASAALSTSALVSHGSEPHSVEAENEAVTAAASVGSSAVLAAPGSPNASTEEARLQMEREAAVTGGGAEGDGEGEGGESEGFAGSGHGRVALLGPARSGTSFAMSWGGEGEEDAETAEGDHDGGSGWEPEEGRPIGIITIEDVIEELIRSEIVDETDRYVDNDRRIRVDPARRAQDLPEHLARVLAVAGASRKAAAALHRVRSGAAAAAVGGLVGSGVSPGPRRSLGTAFGWGRESTGGLSGDLSVHAVGGGGSWVSARGPQTSALRVPLLSGEQQA